MGGFLGVGGSSANTDRGNQLAATQGNWNLFNQGMAMGTAGQATGQGTLNTSLDTLGGAKDYFKSLLTAGRTQTQANAAPAINNTLDSADAVKRTEATMGTGRTGGTAATNRSAGTATTSKIDDIISSTLNTGKATGAQGLQSVAQTEAGVGGTQLNNALSLLGISQGSVEAILSNATDSRKTSYAINQQAQNEWGNLAGLLLTLGMGG